MQKHKMCLTKQAGHDFLLPSGFGFIHPGSIIFSLSPKSIPKVWLYVPCFPPLKLSKPQAQSKENQSWRLLYLRSYGRESLGHYLHPPQPCPGSRNEHDVRLETSKGQTCLLPCLPLLWLTRLSAQIKAKCRFVRVSHEWTLHNQKYQPLFNVFKLIQVDQERAEIASY